MTHLEPNLQPPYYIVVGEIIGLAPDHRNQPRNQRGAAYSIWDNIYSKELAGVICRIQAAKALVPMEYRVEEVTL